MQNTWCLKFQNGNNSYFSVGQTDTYFVDRKMWMRKVLSSPGEDTKCSILFSQHQWVPFYHQGVLLWMGKHTGELRPALQGWEDSAHSHRLGSGCHNRKFGQALSQLLTFHLELQFSLEWDGARVKRQSLDCVTKVLFKGDCISQIRVSLVFPLSLQKVNTVHGLRQQSRRVALHPFLRMHPVQSSLCKDQTLNWEVRVTLPHLEMSNLFLQFL